VKCAFVFATAALLAPAASAQPVQPLTDGLIGPALFISDVARALKFYRDGLGMKVGIEMGAPARHETILTFGGDPRAPGIILLSDRTAKTPAPIEHGHGYDRVVLRVGDLSAVEARLKRGGFTTTPIRDVAMGYRMMLATDPDGYRLELVETRPRP
jgi:catechol 2,3-dioxygenase-like lactoylglutathione lyase family enzyme